MITRRILSFDHPALEGLELPVTEIEGDRPGPTLCLLAGVHGCEYSSIQAVRSLVHDFDPATLSGRVRALAFTNPVSFVTRTPFVSPQDGKNPNRSYPGDENGTFSDVLAWHVFQELIEPSDYLIDLHGGDMVEALEPFVLFDESEVIGQARRMASAFGFANIVCPPREQRIEGTTVAAACDAGIPAMVAEAGGRGLLEHTAVTLLSDGVRSVMRELGMLSGSPSPANERYLNRRFVWLRSPAAGWWNPSVWPGEEVTAGQELGVIEDLFGEVVETIIAPDDGIILFMTSVPAMAADGILLGIGAQREQFDTA